MSDAERIAPRDLFDRAAMTQRKRARQTALAKTLSGAPLPTPMADVDAFVDGLDERAQVLGDEARPLAVDVA